MNPIPVDIDKVKRVVDILVKAQAIDAILSTMDHAYGEVNVKVSIQHGSIKTIAVTNTKTVKIE
jgi:hypothetical protein